MVSRPFDDDALRRHHPPSRAAGPRVVGQLEHGRLQPTLAVLVAPSVASR
jgi:hypothetical protein